MAYGPDDRRSLNLAQHFAPMQGNVIGLVALDLELRLVLAGMVNVAFVLRIFSVNFDYSSGHMAGLGIPANMITDFKLLCHVSLPILAKKLKCQRRCFARGYGIEHLRNFCTRRITLAFDDSEHAVNGARN
jgi:hypothetical protein